MEARQLLATITVNTTGDADGLDGSNTLSLRQAIEISNGTLAIGTLSITQATLVSGTLSTPNTIDFAIPGTGPFTISPGSALPAITSPVILDGYSQPGAHPNTNGPWQAKNTVIAIAVDGSHAGASASGLEVDASHSTIEGLAIGGFNVGISLGGILSNVISQSNQIEGNFIGTDVTGTQARPNGIGINGRDESTTIGGTTPGAGNLVSGNTSFGMTFDDSDVIQGNFVGTDITGTKALPNYGDGVEAVSTSDTIGGTTPGAGNLISGNLGNGVSSQLGVYLLEGNRIGTDATGTRALPNQLNGLAIYSGTVTGFGEASTIGGTAAGAGNVISGNTQNGLSLGPVNLIQGNFIGTDPTGSVAIPNGLAGLFLGAGQDTIGGTTPGSGNVISGNRGDGVASHSSGNLIQGNFIGTDATGSVAIPNAGDGFNSISFSLTQGVNGSDTIGGTAAGAGNVISGNAGNGLTIGNATLVEGNLIGTNLAGTLAIPNGAAGVTFAQFTSSFGTDFQVVRAVSDTIGGTAAGAGNIISGNVSDGLRISTGNLVQGNRIGTDVTGSTPLPNGGDGLFVIGTANTIGGTTAGAANVISFNGGAGVDDASTYQGNGPGTTISANSIDANKNLGIELGVGIAPNNPLGSPNAPNRLQPYPTLSSASLTGTGTLISGTIDAQPSTAYLIEFFSSPVADPSGFGQGRTYLGSAVVATDATGHASISYLATSNLIGQAVSATATDPNGNTSEFARDVIAGYPTTTTLIGPGATATLGKPTTFSAVVTATSHGTPTGFVEFIQDGIGLGSAPLNASGVAVFITDALAPGPHAINAVYLGDGVHASSPSSSLALSVFAPHAFAGPSVTSVVFNGKNALTITYNRGLEIPPVYDLTNYKIVGPGQKAITVESAIYNPTNASVTLTTLQALDPNQSYQLTINGQTGDRIVDVFGIPLHGQAHAGPGHNYVGKIQKAPALKVAHPAGPKPKAHASAVKKHH